VGTSFKVSGYVRDDGQPLSGVVVSIYVNGSYVTSATTDVNGYYSANIWISTIGSHTLKASALGVSASRTILITYVPYVFSVSISAPSSVEAGQSFTVSGYVKDQYGYGYGGVTVKLYRNDSLFASVFTDSSGYYSKSTSISTAGTYTLKAVADSKQATRSITVTAPPPPPPPPPPLEATFSASPTTGPVPLAVTFTIGISGGVSPYTWSLDPGDGSTPYTGSRSAAGSFTKAHTYTRAGTFTATLTVTDALGATARNKATATPGALALTKETIIGVAAPLIAGIILIKAVQKR